LDLQFISSGVAARSLQDALIWLSGLTPKKTLELPTKDYQPLAHFHAGSALDCVKKDHCATKNGGVLRACGEPCTRQSRQRQS
jgi:hypothetical protein